jgi:hypothetical protein
LPGKEGERMTSTAVEERCAACGLVFGPLATRYRLGGIDGPHCWVCRDRLCGQGAAWCGVPVLRERAGREVRPGAEVRVIDCLDFDEKHGCD